MGGTCEQGRDTTCGALGLYPLPPTLQRQGLADLLGLDQRLIAIIAEPVALRVLVQRTVTDQPLASVEHHVAKRRHPAGVVAFEKPRTAALAIPDLAAHR